MLGQDTDLSKLFLPSENKNSIIIIIIIVNIIVIIAADRTH